MRHRRSKKQKNGREIETLAPSDLKKDDILNTTVARSLHFLSKTIKIITNLVTIILRNFKDNKTYFIIKV